MRICRGEDRGLSIFPGGGGGGGGCAKSGKEELLKGRSNRLLALLGSANRTFSEIDLESAAGGLKLKS